MSRGSTPSAALALLLSVGLLAWAGGDAAAKPGKHGPKPVPTASATPTPVPTATPRPTPTPTPSPAATPAPTVRWRPGIDVSHWQGAIDWARVAAAGKRFAIIKATDGRTMTDSRYLTNRRGAKANGIRVTAYHYARPDLTAGDALLEAEHFVLVSRLTGGDLLPVLDLEEHGGLTVDQLRTWVRTWLARVTLRVGAKPIIYTSAGFWSRYMGNSTFFQAAGYSLWVAHWGVTSPQLPASGWGGQGWMMWQHTSSGTVPGISGRVDLDWYRFGDFSRMSIP